VGSPGGCLRSEKFKLLQSQHNGIMREMGHNQRQNLHTHQLTALELADQLHQSQILESGAGTPVGRDRPQTTDEVLSPIRVEAIKIQDECTSPGILSSP
jgi:hypothetical protein